MPNGDKKKKAEGLMRSSESKKKAAAEQESLGRAQIRNRVKEGSMGSVASFTKKPGDANKSIPVGKQRIGIANRLKEDARRDSLESVRTYPPNASGGSASASRSPKRVAMKSAASPASKSSKMAKGKSSKKGY